MFICVYLWTVFYDLSVGILSFFSLAKAQRILGLDEKFSEGMKVLLEKMPAQENWNLPFKSLQEGEYFFKKNNIR